MPRQGVGTSREYQDRTEAFREGFVFASLHCVAVTDDDRVRELDDVRHRPCYFTLVKTSQVSPPLRDLKKYIPSAISLLLGKYVKT